MSTRVMEQQNRAEQKSPRKSRSMTVGIVLLQILQLYLVIAGGTVNDHKSLEELYTEGITAYYDGNNDWKTVISSMSALVSSYNAVTDQKERCSDACRGKSGSIPPDYHEDKELEYFHYAVERALCEEKCQEDGEMVARKAGVSSRVEEFLQAREPHNYLQISLFNENLVKEAAAHCYTYEYFNPHDQIARSNRAVYQNRLNDTNVDRKETLKYRDLYILGQKLYEDEKFEEMISVFEEALVAYTAELHRCRLGCEHSFKYTLNLEFSSALSSMYLSVLECKQSCRERLGEFRNNTTSVPFLGSFFYYLQFGYYKLNKMGEAARCLTSQKRLEPTSEVLRKNAAHYMQSGATKNDFVEREDTKTLLDMLDAEGDALRVLQRVYQENIKEDEGEKDDAKLLEDDFRQYPIGGHQQEDQNEPDANHKSGGNIDQETANDGEVAEHDSKESSVAEVDRELNIVPDKFTVVETAADHNGVERVLADDLLTPAQCQALLELAKRCIEGDGYNRKSPHTQSEKFEGLTIIAAAEAAANKEIEPILAELYLNSSKKARDIVADEFKLETPLYFSYTHLVCRTAKEGIAQDDRVDLSHPVHADNCILEETGECVKRLPAYTWRDYSAILYLNEEFEGGKFFFAHSPKDLSPQHYVSPKCGRMVGFSAGKENMHGVTAVTRGKRCAVALWFTLDSTHREGSFDVAEVLLGSIS